MISIPDTIEKSLNFLKNKMNGGDVIVDDATNPLVNLIEMASIIQADAVLTNEINTFGLFPESAFTTSQIMSFVNNIENMKFASPARAIFLVYVNVLDMIAQGVEYNPNEFLITIPKYTKIVVEDSTTFTIINDIEIRYKRLNTIKSSVQMMVNSDSAEITNDMSNLVSDIVTDRNDNVDWLVFEMPAEQIVIDFHEDTILAGEEYSETFKLPGNFHRIEVFVRESNSTDFVQYKTTFNKNVYSIIEKLALIEVLPTTVKVTLINTSSFLRNQISGSVLVKIYTTSGFVEIPLVDLEVNDFRLIFGDSGNIASAAAIDRVNYRITSNMIVSGGDSGDDFDTIKNRVIYNTVYNPDNHVTLDDMRLNNLGFLVSKVETFNDTTFLLSKDLRLSSEKSNSSYLGMFGDIVFIDTANVDELKNISVIEDRLTIISGATFKNENGTLKPVSNKEYSDAVSGIKYNPDEYGNRYFTTPFFYTSKVTDINVPAQMYYLEPSLNGFYIDSINSSNISYSSNIDKMHVLRQDTKFVLMFTVISNDEVKSNKSIGLRLQLSIPITNSDEFIHYEATYDSGRDLYFIEVETDFFLNDDEIRIINGTRFIESRNVKINSKVKVIVFYKNQYAINEFSSNGEIVVDEDCIALSKQFVNFNFGYVFKNMETTVYDTPPMPVYKRYEEDTYLRYKTDVYPNVEDGLELYNLTEYNPDFEADKFLNLKYKAGDYVLDEDGNMIIEHHIGDALLDEAGEPVEIGKTDGFKNLIVMTYQLENFVAKDTVTMGEQINKMIYQIDQIDMRSMSDKSLETTTLLFRPLHSNVRIYVDNIKKYIDPLISPSIRLYSRNKKLLETMDIQSIRRDVGMFLEERLRQNSTIIISEITDMMKKEIFSGSDIFTIGLTLDDKLEGLDVVSFADNTRGLYIKRKVLDEKIIYDIKIKDVVSV